MWGVVSSVGVVSGGKVSSYDCDDVDVLDLVADVDVGVVVVVVAVDADVDVDV
jgi:hypothetical protein